MEPFKNVIFNAGKVSLGLSFRVSGVSLDDSMSSADVKQQVTQRVILLSHKDN